MPLGGLSQYNKPEFKKVHTFRMYHYDYKKKKKKTITNAVEVVMGTQLCEAHLVVISFLLRSHSNELRKFDHQIEDCGLAILEPALFLWCKKLM